MEFAAISAAKGERHLRIDAVKTEAAASLVGEEEGKIPPGLFGKLFKALESRVMRGAVIETGIRIDGSSGDRASACEPAPDKVTLICRL